MSDKGWVGRALAAGGVRAAAFYVTTTYIIPLGAPIVTVAIGYASGVPWFGIWLGALAAFAFVSTGLLRFTEWRFRQKVHDKLAFAAVMVGKDISSGGIIIGLRLHNSALFPIEFSLKNLLTRLGDKVPSKTTYDSPGTISIPAEGVGWFWDNAIKVDNPPKPGTIEGHMEYELVYGRSGRLRYKLAGKKQIIIAFNEQGYRAMLLGMKLSEPCLAGSRPTVLAMVAKLIPARRFGIRIVFPRLLARIHVMWPSF